MKLFVQIAALYYLAAALGTRMAVVGGNMSPEWAATGIAIAAVYQGGYRMAGGVWPGGFAFEI